MDSTTKFRWGNQMVFWDVEDWSILKNLDPRLVSEKITSYLYENGYLGPEMLINFFVDDDAPKYLTYVFQRAGMRLFSLPKGNKHARVHRMTVRCLQWALYGCRGPSSLFIISESIKEEKQLVHPPMDRNRFNLVFLDPGSVLVNCQGSPLEIRQRGVPIGGMTEDDLFERGRPSLFGVPVGGRYIRNVDDGSIVVDLDNLDNSSSFSTAAYENMILDMSPNQLGHLSSTWVADIINLNGDTGVFWDVVDFPIPAEYYEPALISDLIKSGLDKQGCCNGSVSIRLYDVEDEKTTKQEVIDKYEAAGVSFNFVPEVAEADGYARYHKMLVDILRWAVDSPKKSNLIVLSNNMDESSLSSIRGLQTTRYHNVVLVDPPVSSAWLWNWLTLHLPSKQI